MNVTVIVVELLIMFLVIGLLLINPVTFISDYPPEIQEIYYKSQNKEAEKEKLKTLRLRFRLSESDLRQMRLQERSTMLLYRQ